jgi:methyltransferase (TIGR00027 family)
MLVRNISDTAIWVAMYRAAESERPDAIFHDPYARRLAGERGAEIVRTLPGAKSMAWAMVVRTAVLDELIMTAITTGGADTVLNLAAGLDTRPFRLDLSASLSWIEVDLPEILAYKAEIMAGERPRCVLETVALDLADRPARQALFQRVGAEGRRILVITEGLLVYLPADEVSALATDLLNTATVKWWAFDLASVGVLRMLRRTQSRLGGGTTFQFAPREGTQFFERLGWRVVEFRLSIHEARRLGREMRMAWLFRRLAKFDLRQPQEKSQWRTGFVLLEPASQR